MPKQIKSPAKIVQLLRKCEAARSFSDCKDCPYYADNCDALLRDAAAVIETLMGGEPNGKGT